jgi:hypothetical protein
MLAKPEAARRERVGDLAVTGAATGQLLARAGCPVVMHDLQPEVTGTDLGRAAINDPRWYPIAVLHERRRGRLLVTRRLVDRIAGATEEVPSSFDVSRGAGIGGVARASLADELR